MSLVHIQGASSNSKPFRSGPKKSWSEKVRLSARAPDSKRTERSSAFLDVASRAHYEAPLLLAHDPRLAGCCGRCICSDSGRRRCRATRIDHAAVGAEAQEMMPPTTRGSMEKALTLQMSIGYVPAVHAGRVVSNGRRLNVIGCTRGACDLYCVREVVICNTRIHHGQRSNSPIVDSPRVAGTPFAGTPFARCGLVFARCGRAHVRARFR